MNKSKRLKSPQRVRLTKALIAALPVPAPEEPRVIVYDSIVQKLVVRVYASGTRAFYLLKRVGGRMVWLKLGVFPEMSLESARKAAERALGQFAIGSNPADARRADRAEMLFGEMFEQYFSDHVLKQGKKTHAEIRTCYERFLAPLTDAPKNKHGRERTRHAAGVLWHKRKLSAIHYPDVMKLHSNIGRTHPIAANRTIELLRSDRREAHESGHT